MAVGPRKALFGAERQHVRELIERVAPELILGISFQASASRFVASAIEAIRQSRSPRAAKLETILSRVASFGEDGPWSAIQSYVAAEAAPDILFSLSENRFSAAIQLYLKDPERFEQAVVAADADGRMRKQHWARYHRERSSEVSEPVGEALDGFGDAVVGCMKCIRPGGRRTLISFERQVVRHRGGPPEKLLQIAVVAEKRPKTAVAFDDNDELSPVFHSDVEIADIEYNLTSGTIDVMVAGGEAAQRRVAHAFVKYWGGQDEFLIDETFRKVHLGALQRGAPFTIPHRSQIRAVEMLEMTFRKPRGQTLRTDAGYGFAIAGKNALSEDDDCRVGYQQLRNPADRLIEARLRVHFRDARHPPVDVWLKADDRTNFNECREDEAEEIEELLESWKVIGNDIKPQTNLERQWLALKKSPKSPRKAPASQKKTAKARSLVG